MTWGKIDDKLWGHQKWMATPAPARGLWITALSWCMDQGTDGHVPRHVLPFLGSTPRHANALVTSGLWETADGGWQFHDWLAYQPDAASVRAKRQAESEGGKRGAHTQWHVKKNIRVPDCPFCAEDGPVSDGGAQGVPHMGGQKGVTRGANAPGPGPVPVPTNSRNVDTGTPRNARERDEPEPHPHTELDPVKLLASAGLAQHEVRPFMVDLKGNGAKSAARVINALHRDGRLTARIAEWRAETDLATEAARRPKPGKRTTDDRVREGMELAARLAAEEAEAAQPNIIHFPQLTEGA
jgi:hypothetical protein